jgi:hypothetical protein
MIGPVKSHPHVELEGWRHAARVVDHHEAGAYVELSLL